ncbi:MAG TPA: tetratricopeptide repeat protein, partial [Polyangiaceae bacterium]|nr:tetratricopeptide repeat protein [Polyangiaceae bacterium]
MSTDPGLDQLSREELVKRARALGARRPEVMTRVELRDEIVRLSESDPMARRRSRGWLGVARDLVASVMDAGLNMPSAAAAIRGEGRSADDTTGPPPVATLTLAEIYLAQGHAERALSTLEEVLAAEPDHAAALALR